MKKALMLSYLFLVCTVLWPVEMAWWKYVGSKRELKGKT